jgi:hypothetical protein
VLLYTIRQLSECPTGAAQPEGHKYRERQIKIHVNLMKNINEFRKVNGEVS